MLIITSSSFVFRFLKEGRNSSANLTNSSSGALTELEIAEIHHKIERANAEQKVYNEEAFGPLASDAPIIVIQVHTRLTYLRHLIVSLAQAKDIEQALLYQLSRAERRLLQGHADLLSAQHTDSSPYVSRRRTQRLSAKYSQRAVSCLRRLYSISSNLPRIHSSLLFCKPQGLKFKMHQRQTSGFVRSLQGGKVYANQASLVVESEQSLRPIIGDEEPHRDGSLPRGGSLCRRRFLTRAQTHGAHL